MQTLEILNSMPDSEDIKTLKLFERLLIVKEQGFLTKEQLVKILKWKSPRPLKHYGINNEKDIKEITTLAFSTENDCLKLHILTALSGVNYPAASAILMFYDKCKYPVLDIRAWRQLYILELVNSNPRGKSFNIGHCKTYLTVIRNLSVELGLTARQVEKRLFNLDKKNQVGKLYG